MTTVSPFHNINARTINPSSRCSEKNSLAHASAMGCIESCHCATFIPAAARPEKCACGHDIEEHTPCLLSKDRVFTHPRYSARGDCPECGLAAERHPRLCAHFGGRVLSGARKGEPCRNFISSRVTKCRIHESSPRPTPHRQATTGLFQSFRLESSRAPVSPKKAS